MEKHYFGLLGANRVNEIVTILLIAVSVYWRSCDVLVAVVSTEQGRTH